MCVCACVYLSPSSPPDSKLPDGMDTVLFILRSQLGITLSLAVVD